MTAINPEKLKAQINEITDKNLLPQDIVCELQKLLDFYADRTFRPGKQAALPSTLSTYNVPKPVIRMLSNEIAALAQAKPQLALALASELWQKPNLELKTLAQTILRHLTNEYAGEIFSLVESWVLNCKNKSLLPDLSLVALQNIRQQLPLDLLRQIQEWINHNNSSIQKFGFLCLQHSIETIPFDYLPVLFKTITPFLSYCPPSLRAEMISVIKLLAQRSAKETAFLLRSAYIERPHSGIARLIKPSLDSFPPDLQEDLHQMIQQN
jgi:hypothetical protein